MYLRVGLWDEQELLYTNGQNADKGARVDLKQSMQARRARVFHRLVNIEEARCRVW